MKKQLMIALLSITPALGVVAQDKLYKDEFPLGDIILLVTMLHPYIHNKDTHYSLSRRPLFPIEARNIAIFKLSHQLPSQNKEIFPFTLNSLIFNAIHIP